MFGLIYTLITSTGSIFHAINKCKENEENKIKYKHPDGLTYLDINGKSRLISNNELVFYTHDKNGDYVLENTTGYIYKNFSEEKRNKEVTERIGKSAVNNETTYCIDDNNHKNDCYCKGRRFKDLKTGDVYVIRYIKYKYYYMDVSNGLIIRKTDWQINEDEKTKNIKTYLDDVIDIEEFNKKQKDIKNKHMLFRDFDYNFYCNINK